jgi:RNA polymerase primary sigma factor
MTSDGIGRYLNEIGRIPLLSAAEEVHQSRMVQEWLTWPGGPDAAPRGVQRRGLRAKNRMLEGNVRLVVSLAKKFSAIGERKGLGLADLIQEGTIGLVRSVEKFDPEKGYKFSTYAYWWIRQSIHKALNQGGTIRVPSYINELLTKLRRVTEDLAAQGVVNPSRAQLAAAVDLPLDRLAAALDGPWATRHVVSLDSPVLASDGDCGTVMDTVGGMDEDYLARTELWEMAQDLRALLPDDFAIVELRETEEASFADLGDLLGGIGRTNARHRFNAARERLRIVGGSRLKEMLAS